MSSRAAGATPSPISRLQPDQNSKKSPDIRDTFQVAVAKDCVVRNQEQKAKLSNEFEASIMARAKSRQLNWEV